jgi:hypothetical protein
MTAEFPLPRYGMPRTWRRETLGHEVDAVHKRLFGKALMPWQRYVADVAAELSDEQDVADRIAERVGMLVYEEVRLTVPRQSGKSQLVTAIKVWRAESEHFRQYGPQNIISAAQKALSAAKRLRFIEYPAILKAFTEDGVDHNWANGNEHVTLTETGGTLWITANKADSGHGETLDMAVLDEAFSLKGYDLEQALSPAMITREETQLWVLSTAGTLDLSVYLWDKVQDGRERCQLELIDTVCYFEWSLPDEANPADESLWPAVMPALGITQSLAKMRKQFQKLPLSEFRRAHLNQWVVRADPAVIPEGPWSAAAAPKSKLVDGLFYAVDVNQDRTSGSISVAGLASDGRWHVEVIKSAPGTDWIVPALRKLKPETGHLGIDSSNAAASLEPQLKRHGIEIRWLNVRDAVRAAGAFYDGVVNKTLVHIGQQSLNDAVAVSARRKIGPAWAFARSTTVDSTPLISAAQALWLAIEPEPEPEQWSWGPGAKKETA